MLKQLFVILVLTVAVVSAQMEDAMDPHHMHHAMEDEPAAVFTGMPSALSLTVPMSMDGSGTSWLPAHSAVPMHMFHSGDWMFMTHGNLFVRYTDHGGPRGDAAFSAPNWFMASAQRTVTEGQQITFRTMLSLDRVTEGGDGYPLLLQSGETWNGIALVDRQHPHDMVAELSAIYSISFTPHAGAFLYFGYPGEPALGPTAFMHRPSSQFNADAPIGHHWQDATHITFGVSTLGLILHNVKLEGSVFTGREPDENRYNFEAPLFDSYSGRISYNPSHQFAMQASYGFIKDPEGHGDDVTRFSASVLHSVNINEESSLHTSLIWGQNEDHHVPLSSLLFETAYTIGRLGLYGRYEAVSKPRFDLGIFIDNGNVEQLRQYTGGISYLIAEEDSYSLRMGVQGMVSGVSTFLEQYYGKNPVSWQVYIQLM
jgi:hypothetical protein